MADQDALLVARVVAEDDRRAFELLVLRHQSRLRKLLRKLTHNDVALADELAQETFIKVYQSIASFKGKAKFSTWLYRIAYNTFISHQRRKKLMEEEYTPENFDEAGQDLRLNESIDIAKALAQLPFRQQAIFDLHYQQGFSHHEISEILALPLGTVKSDLLRGRETLKKHLKQA